MSPFNYGAKWIQSWGIFFPNPSLTHLHENTSCVFTPTAIEGAIVCKHKELSFLYAKKKLCFEIFGKKIVDGQITQKSNMIFKSWKSKVENM